MESCRLFAGVSPEPIKSEDNLTRKMNVETECHTITLGGDTTPTKLYFIKNGDKAYLFSLEFYFVSYTYKGQQYGLLKCGVHSSCFEQKDKYKDSIFGSEMTGKHLSNFKKFINSLEALKDKNNKSMVSEIKQYHKTIVYSYYSSKQIPEQKQFIDIFIQPLLVEYVTHFFLINRAIKRYLYITNISDGNYKTIINNLHKHHRIKTISITSKDNKKRSHTSLSDSFECIFAKTHRPIHTEFINIINDACNFIKNVFIPKYGNIWDRCIFIESNDVDDFRQRLIKKTQNTTIIRVKVDKNEKWELPGLSDFPGITLCNHGYAVATHFIPRLVARVEEANEQTV